MEAAVAVVVGSGLHVANPAATKQQLKFTQQSTNALVVAAETEATSMAEASVGGYRMVETPGPGVALIITQQ